MAPQTPAAFPLTLSDIIGLLGRLAVVLRYFLSALTLNVQVFETEHVSLVFDQREPYCIRHGLPALAVGGYVHIAMTFEYLERAGLARLSLQRSAAISLLASH